MSVTKPDVTAFDNDNDSIATARAELETLVTSFNTIADEYNAGTLGGGAQMAQLTCSRNNAPGSNGVITANASGTFNFDGVDDSNGFVTLNDSSGQGDGFYLETGSYHIAISIYFEADASTAFMDSDLEFDLKKTSSTVFSRRNMSSYTTEAHFTGIVTSAGSDLFELGYSWQDTGRTCTFKEQGVSNADPVLRVDIINLT